jgi:hypothetical protein
MKITYIDNLDPIKNEISKKNRTIFVRLLALKL